MYLQEEDIPQFSIAERKTRIQALLVDFLVIIIISMVAIRVWAQPYEDADGAIIYQLSGLPAFLLLLTNFLYLVIPEMLSGQTLGKKLAGIKVISINGDDVSPVQVIKRHLCDIVDWLPFLFIVFFIVTANNKNRQRVGDMFAKTIVVTA